MAKEKLAPLSVKTQKVAGIDIGNSFHYVTVAPELTEENVRKFGTFTKELHALGDWLVSLGITSVAMESTGVYWMGIYEILEEKGLEVLLVNARYPKQVSGRKTDVSDSAWIQQLHSYGLLPGSYIPASHTRVLRHYVRQRNSLAKSKATYLQRLGKSLQLMNVKLQNVVSKLETKVGMQIVRAIASGKHDAKDLAQFHTPQMKASQEELVLALQGNYRQEYLFSLKQALSSYDFIQTQMEECELEIEKLLHTQQTGEVLDDSNGSTSFKSFKKKD